MNQSRLLNYPLSAQPTTTPKTTLTETCGVVTMMRPIRGSTSSSMRWFPIA